jgi:exonuclease SbcC
MIPRHLYISGFLSYRQPVEVDFTTFDLACISGHNGAGKSSLLDAMTWVLFGQARKRDESIINLQSKAAEVRLIFEYEGNIYRVQRTLPRGKSTLLEFQIADTSNGDPQWRPLSERSTRETQARIEETLHLDYDTFINAAFFLQGKADQFTQQPPGKRKEILSSILGLEMWETYKERTAERRKDLEHQLSEWEGRIAEIDAELSQEAPRKARLKELEEQLAQHSAARASQESLVENLKTLAATLAEQRRSAENLRAALEQSQAALARLESRHAELQAQRAAQADLLQRADRIEAAYRAWQDARLELEKWEDLARQFRQHDEKRQPLLRQIEAEKARLEQERQSLHASQEEIHQLILQRTELHQKIEETQKALEEAEQQVEQARQLEQEINAARQRQAELKKENETLKAHMDEIKERLERLQEVAQAQCPLCGQTLTAEHRQQTIAQLQQEGKAAGDQYRANLQEMRELGNRLQEMDQQVQSLRPADGRRVALSGALSQWQERQAAAEKKIGEWENQGAKRLQELNQMLQNETYASEARQQLQQLDEELTRLGYDPNAHESARRAEAEGRQAENEYRQLETARQLIHQIESELTSLNTEISQRRTEIQESEKRYNEIAAALQNFTVPDVETAENELLRLRAQENRTREEVSQARQAVNVLTELRARKAEYQAQSEELRRAIARHKTLERAFGKDGVPALLIEQALPQIEAKANEILERLSDGQMSIRFLTQAEYKDKKRDDLKETLNIQISDGAGLRDYEMYSGGEAFRVNFAIRLALSEVLAQRKGARLQTLVIDEGFGSQDAQGRQRLVEAINLVKGDFAKILVITHLDELKDAFPTRIEVEKTEEGSRVRIL